MRQLWQAGAAVVALPRLAWLVPALVMVSSCTGAEGPTPPAPVGSTAGLQSLASSDTVSMTAAAPALDVQGQAPVNTAPADAAPAFAGPEPSTATVAAAPAMTGAATARLASAPIQFAPITGTTREVVAPLSDRLLARARERGVALAGSGVRPAYVVKGYFSEVPEAGASTVLYVWDITDAGGNRLHRIQGQAKGAGSGGWAAVPAATMQQIADRTIDELAVWLAGQPG